MSTFNINEVNLVSGTELATGALLMIAHPRSMDPGENPKTIFVHRDLHGNWKSLGSVSWLPEWVSGNPAQDSVVIIHKYGSCLEFNAEQHTFSKVHITDEDIDRSDLRFCQVVDNQLYIGGTNRYLFQQVGTDWEEISIEAMYGEPMPSSFENITGFNADELYAFGWEGVIWTNKDNGWKQAETPTEYMLFDGAVLEDKVYIAGQLGVILEGRGDTWKSIENNISSADFVSVCAFDGAVYFSNTKHILRFKDGALEVFHESTDAFPTYQLFVGPSGLWSVSSRCLALYDGKAWKMIQE